MYKLEFLPIAKKDIDDIIFYISSTLKNPSAAIKLSKFFIKGARSILEFPYGVSEYKTIIKLKNVYRCIKIKNFLMFYIIEEKDKNIIIVRVLYQKMDIKNVLE